MERMYLRPRLADEGQDNRLRALATLEIRCIWQRRLTLSESPPWRSDERFGTPSTRSATRRWGRNCEWSGIVTRSAGPERHRHGTHSAWWRAHGPRLRRLQVPGAGRRGVGCRGARDRITSPYLFLVVTAIGVALAVLAMLRNRQIVTFIDVDMAAQAASSAFVSVIRFIYGVVMSAGGLCGQALETARPNP